MEIVHNDDELRVYMATAVKEISHDAPILVDKYIVGKELEIDAIADGKNVYIPGVMNISSVRGFTLVTQLVYILHRSSMRR